MAGVRFGCSRVSAAGGLVLADEMGAEGLHVFRPRTGLSVLTFQNALPFPIGIPTDDTVLLCPRGPQGWR